MTRAITACAIGHAFRATACPICTAAERAQTMVGIVLNGWRACTKCKKVQPPTGFPPQPDRESGRHSWCHSCHRARVNALYARATPEQLARRAERKRQRRERVKALGICSGCLSRPAMQGHKSCAACLDRDKGRVRTTP